MRSILNFNKMIHLNNNPSHDGFNDMKLAQEKFSEMTHFCLDNDIFLKDDNKKEIFLPFRYCSFDFIKCIDVSSDEMLSITRKFISNTSWVHRFKKLILLGSILIENDNNSLNEFLILGDRLRQKTLDEQDCDNFKKAIDAPLAILLRHDDYESFNDNSITAGFIRRMYDKKYVMGESIKVFESKRSGRSPDLVKRLVVILNHKKVSDVNNNIGNVEWKHSWSVMGHWRKISPNMLGKDREGEYVIVGRTWVKDCIKGDGPFIKKTRIKKGELECRV